MPGTELSPPSTHAENARNSSRSKGGSKGKEHAEGKDRANSPCGLRRPCAPGTSQQLQQQQVKSPVMMVSPKESFSNSAHLQTMLQEQQQAVLIQQYSGDAATRPPFFHISSLRHPSIIHLPHSSILSLKAAQTHMHALPHGINVAGLEWLRKEACSTQRTESVLNRISKVAHPVCSLPSPEAVTSMWSTSVAQQYSSPSKQNCTVVEKEGANHIEENHPLFTNGLCKWPGCEQVFEEYDQFLKHLHSDHQLDDKSTAQCRIQKEVVQQLESQLALEKERLLAMTAQLNTQMFEQKTSFNTKTEGCENGRIMKNGLSAFACSGLGGTIHSRKDPSESPLTMKHPLWDSHAVPFFPDLLHSVEHYKFNNIRPPFTYASLIRWAILESPEKQLTLNEIYHWFMRMFAYFRHNTATWKNAVRHNLSLHKCFVRVENVKGAVWTVDEAEFQRRRGQKFTRGQEMKWLTPYACLAHQDTWLHIHPGSSL
ncbi:forkhead box protein P3 isoform X2 [Protopterus annectens]|nr:forkhead box protein P3 isoform X2 [Protopterus annectens]